MPIHFFSEEIPFTIKNPDRYQNWLNKVIQDHNKTLEELSIIFCSDDYLLQINTQYLNHDYYTDIITFDQSEQEESIEGDIFISIDRVESNAETNNVPFESELSRVMVHGVLHLIGFHDKSPDEQMVMRQKEDACLSLLNNLGST